MPWRRRIETDKSEVSRYRSPLSRRARPWSRRGDRGRTSLRRVRPLFVYMILGISINQSKSINQPSPVKNGRNRLRFSFFTGSFSDAVLRLRVDWCLILFPDLWVSVGRTVDGLETSLRNRPTNCKTRVFYKSMSITQNDKNPITHTTARRESQLFVVRLGRGRLHGHLLLHRFPRRQFGYHNRYLAYCIRMFWCYRILIIGVVSHGSLHTVNSVAWFIIMNGKNRAMISAGLPNLFRP